MFDARANASALLHSVFGFNAFRSGQEEIVRALTLPTSLPQAAHHSAIRPAPSFAVEEGSVAVRSGGRVTRRAQQFRARYCRKGRDH